MQHVGRRERLERRVAALPTRAQSVGDAAEVLLHRRVLQMRRKQPEAPFEDVRRSADAGVGEERRGQSRSAPRSRSAGTWSACRPPSTRAGPPRSCRPCPQPRRAAARRGRESCRCLRRCQTVRRGRSDESRGDGTGPMTRCRRGTRSRWRPQSRESGRGPSPCAVPASASAAATAGLLMCTIDSLCVSSYSSACDSEALANAAVGAARASPVPKIRDGPPAT